MSTFSKHPSRFPAYYPNCLVRGREALVWDSYDHQYIDWSQGLGSTGVFGHASPLILNDLAASIADGSAFHTETRLLKETSQLFCSKTETEAVRFCLNGTDATASAVRLARAVTDRKVILIHRPCYHGSSGSDWFAQTEPPARGVIIDGNVGETYLGEKTDIAALIYELRTEPPSKALSAEIEYVRESGGIIIADEVVNGVRCGWRGLSGYYGLNPDLICYGKALGSGIPAAALAGRYDLMKEFDLDYTNSPVFMSYTNASNSVPLSAVRATCKHATRQVIEDVAWSGELLRTSFDAACSDFHLPFKCVGHPARSFFDFQDHDDLFYLFLSLCARLRVLFYRANFPTIHHTSHVTMDTETAIRTALLVVSSAMKHGGMPYDVEIPRPLYRSDPKR